MFDAATYWEDRYRQGGNSGRGSFGDLARFKAAVINEFVRSHAVETVVEYGCGDGNQLSLAEYPTYVGIDVSPTAIELCRQRFQNDTTKSFQLGGTARADLALSLDVIYHLVDDDVYHQYLCDLFQAPFVIVYSSNKRYWTRPRSRHVKHRRFTEDVPSCYDLIEKIDNPYKTWLSETKSDFYIFSRQADDG